MHFYFVHLSPTYSRSFKAIEEPAFADSPFPQFLTSMNILHVLAAYLPNSFTKVSRAGTEHPGSPDWTAPTLPDLPERESGCWSR